MNKEELDEFFDKVEKRDNELINHQYDADNNS